MTGDGGVAVRTSSIYGSSLKPPPSPPKLDTTLWLVKYLSDVKLIIPNKRKLSIDEANICAKSSNSISTGSSPSNLEESSKTNKRLLLP